MPAPRFRGDYDSLTKIAQGFAQHASRASQTNRNLTQSMNTLKGGDWIGKGATAFYKEMEGEVMPAMIRLAKALEASDRVTRQIGKLIKQAEDDASRLFRLDGIGGLLGGALAGAIGGALGGGLGGAIGEAMGGAGGVGEANPFLVRDPGGLFSDDYMTGLIGLEIPGAGGELGDAMDGLLEAESPEDAETFLLIIADLRGRPVEEMRSEYEKFQELAAERDAAGGVGGLGGGHPSFMGSNTQMRYGQVVGDAFGIDPVFGAMLNPTGGLVGPGNWALAGDDTAVGYHGVVHDAAGYLHTFHDAGPGYDYMGLEGRDTSSPLSGQREGIAHWRGLLGGPSPVSAPSEWVMRGVVGGVDIASSAFEGIKSIF